MFRILILARNGLGRDCLASLLNASPRVAVLAVADDLAALTHAAADTTPDALLVVPGLDGGQDVASADALRAVWPAAAIIAGRLEPAGAGPVRPPSGYRSAIDLSGPGEAIAAALIAAAASPAGRTSDGPEVGAETKPDSPIAGLTGRETEALRHLALGLTSHESAELQGIKSRTVDTHRRRASHKLLGINSVNVANLTRFAIAAGLIEPGAGVADAGGAVKGGSDGPSP